MIKRLKGNTGVDIPAAMRPLAVLAHSDLTSSDSDSSPQVLLLTSSGASDADVPTQPGQYNSDSGLRCRGLNSDSGYLPVIELYGHDFTSVYIYFHLCKPEVLIGPFLKGVK